MNFIRFSVLYCSAVLLVGCAVPAQKKFPPPNDFVPVNQVQITSRFASLEVTPDTLGYEAHKCVPQIVESAQNIKKQLMNFPNSNITEFGHVSSSKSFVVKRTTAVCMQKSSKNFPIFAAEAFFETANPSGVPPDVVDGWYRQIALLIATQGMAKVAYVFGNGNAFVVTYWVEMPQAFGLFYSMDFKKAGAWEKGSLDIQFTYPTMSSASTTKRDDLSQKKYVLSHRVQ